MFDSILVVCVGNICRSSLGERLLKKLLPAKMIASAGLSAMVGHPADPLSVLVAEEHGISLEGHCAQQLTKPLCQEYSLILVMEQHHIDGVCKIAPEVRGKVMLFGHWLNKQEVPDPYRKDKTAFDFVYNLLEKSAMQWVKKLT